MRSCPPSYAVNGISVERDFDAVLPSVDAIVLLRIQRERFAEMPMSDEEYVAAYRLDERRLAPMRNDAIVMHPGPYNRGMELDDCVSSYAGWRYARQVHHGVAVRMAVLDLLVNGPMTRLLITNGRVVDPAASLDALRDVRIRTDALPRSARHLATERRGSGHRRTRRHRRPGLHRHARASARARLSREGDDRDRNRGGGARRFHRGGLYAQHATRPSTIRKS